MKEIVIKNPNVVRRLEEESARSGQDPEILAEELLDQGLSRDENIREKFKNWREKLRPYANKAGLDTDEKIFDVVS